MARGWSPVNEAGGVMYVIPDADGDPDIRTAMPAEINDVLEQLNRATATGGFTAIHLTLEKADIRVSVEESESPGELHFAVHSIRRILETVSPITDHNWYLQRLIPPLYAVGCGVHDVVWREQGGCRRETET